MSRSIADGLARLQRLLPWSNTRRAWLERLSLVGIAAAFAGTAVTMASAAGDGGRVD